MFDVATRLRVVPDDAPSGELAAFVLEELEFLHRPQLFDPPALTQSCPGWCVQHSYTGEEKMGETDWVDHRSAEIQLPSDGNAESTVTRVIEGPSSIPDDPDRFDGVLLCVSGGSGYGAELTLDQLEAFAEALLARVREWRSAS
jgi:hypothetical protein